MRILSISNQDIIDKLSSLREFMNTQWDIIQETNNDKIIDFIKSNQVDMVIIQFSVENYKDIMDAILDIDPKIKIITISQDLVCSELLGCETCVSKYNKRRILEPVELQELYDTIINFDNIGCRYYKAFDDIGGIIGRVVKRFHRYKYDESTNSIELKDTYSVSINEMIEILDLLRKHHIKYELKDNNSILIIS